MYGSLRSKGCAHHLLGPAQREADAVLDAVDIDQCDGYPMLRRGNGSVSGEVYIIDERHWAELDAWEDVPQLYQRSLMILRDGRRAWVYEAA